MGRVRELIFPTNAVADITYIDIREAVLRREFFLEYQPKVSLRTGAIVSVEALIRWQHSSRGRLSPDEFLPLIERTTLIGRLTEFVLDQSIAQCAAFHRQGVQVGVSVNVSPSAVTDNLAEQIARTLRAHSIPAEYLTLEITNTDEFVDISRAAALLEAIHGTGVRLAIDDFGSGHSSAARLQALPFDELKICGSFVGRAYRSPKDAHIVRFATELGRALKLMVVAEGVEDERTLALMHVYGVDAAQGYHFAFPQPASDLLAEAEAISMRARARALSRSIDLRPRGQVRDIRSARHH